MEISALQAFISVARYQSFSIAANHLFVTQPAVSKRVATLEAELETQLFNRVNRQVSLTEAGKQLLPKARDLVDQADELQRYATNLNEDISGNLSIAIAHHIGLHRMPPILRKFRSSYPNVKLDILFEESDHAFQAVTQGDIEFAVITLPKQLPDSLIKEVLWRDDLSVVVAADHPLAKHSITSLTDLSRYSCVLPTKENETRQIIQRQFAKQNLVMPVQMETNNLETLKMLASAGLGWSLLPITMVDDSLTSLDLGLSFERQLGMVFHSKRSLSNAAKALTAMLYSQADDSTGK